MASRVLASNYRLSSTSKLWINNTKKKHQFKVLKLNLFFTSFLYHYLMLMNSQILFSYFFYFYSLSWYIDLFIFRGLTDVFTRRERKARFRHIWERQKILFHKVRRPYSTKLHQFILSYFNGFIKKSRFNNKLLLGKLKTSLLKKKELSKQWKSVLQKVRRVSFSRKIFSKRQKLFKKFYIYLNKKSFFFNFFRKKGIYLKRYKIFFKFFWDSKKRYQAKTTRNIYFLQKKINSLYFQKRLESALCFWKYKKQKTLLWTALKKKPFIIENKKKNKKSKKKKKMTFRDFFKTDLLITNARKKNYVNLPKILKIIFRLQGKQPYYRRCFQLKSRIRLIKEIEDWNTKKLLKYSRWKGKYKQMLRNVKKRILNKSVKGINTKNFYYWHLLYTKGYIKRKLYNNSQRKFLFLKKRSNPKLQYFNNYKSNLPLRKFYNQRSSLKWRQREITIIKKKQFYVFSQRLKKINLKYFKKRNFNINIFIKSRKKNKWISSLRKRKKCYVIRRFNNFFLYFSKPYKNKKIALKILNWQKLKVKKKYIFSLKAKEKPQPLRAVFYHWFWGFRRFQRIHKMISNIEEYKDTFFKDYNGARKKYCLRYMRGFSDVKRSKNILNVKILKYCQLYKLLFYLFYKKNLMDQKSLFFFSRRQEYIFFLKKLYLNFKQKQTWLSLYQASKFFFKTNSAQKINFNNKRLFYTNQYNKLLHNNQFKHKNHYWLSFIKSLMKKKFLKNNIFLVLKKKKFFLLKYLNLIYSLKLSTLFSTTISCFFISCFLLFQQNEHVFKNIVFNRVERYSNFRHLPIYLTQRFAFIFLLSLKFKQFFLFLEYIKFLFLKYSRKQFVIMTFYKLFLKSNFFNYLANVVGFQFSLKGKMNRRPRARRILFFKKNKPAFQSLNLKIHYYSKTFTNYFGTFTAKFWLYYY